MARQLPDAPKVPTPARDARVERLGAYLRTKDLPQLYSAEKFAALEIREVESAGLLVLDPSDPALVERIKGAIRLASQAGLIQSDSLARAVLAALSPVQAPSRCLRQSVYPTGRGAVVEGYRADCTCGWRTTTTSRAEANARADAHAAAALSLPGVSE